MASILAVLPAFSIAVRSVTSEMKEGRNHSRAMSVTCFRMAELPLYRARSHSQACSWAVTGLSQATTTAIRVTIRKKGK